MENFRLPVRADLPVGQGCQKINIDRFLEGGHQIAMMYV
jgi:hypothetical protein